MHDKRFWRTLYERGKEDSILIEIESGDESLGLCQYYVQIGAYGNKKYAMEAENMLKSDIQNISINDVYSTSNPGKLLNSVISGPYENKSAANNVKEKKILYDHFADQKKIDTMKKTNEALQAGIDLVKAGNTADDVAQAFWKVLDKYGIEKTSRTGYSIGIGYPPDWGEHTLNISKGDMTVLQPNVTFHMIAVMQFGNWGVEASEAIRVTDKGSELFCNFSKELHIKS